MENISPYLKTIIGSESDIPDPPWVPFLGFEGVTVILSFVNGLLLPSGKTVPISKLNEKKIPEWDFWERSVFGFFAEASRRIVIELDSISVDKVPLKKLGAKSSGVHTWVDTGNFLCDGCIRVFATLYEAGLINISFIFPIVCKGCENILGQEADNFLKAQLPLSVDELIYLEYLITSIRSVPLILDDKEVLLSDLNYSYCLKLIKELGIDVDEVNEEVHQMYAHIYRSIFVWKTKPKYRKIESLIIEHSPELRGILGVDSLWYKRSKSWIKPIVSKWFCETRRHFLTFYGGDLLDINLDPNISRLQCFGFDSRFIPLHAVACVGSKAIRILNNVLREKIRSYRVSDEKIPLKEALSIYRLSNAVLEDIYFIEDKLASEPLREYLLLKRKVDQDEEFLASLRRKQKILEEYACKDLAILGELIKEALAKVPDNMRKEKNILEEMLMKIVHGAATVSDLAQLADIFLGIMGYPPLVSIARRALSIIQGLGSRK